MHLPRHLWEYRKEHPICASVYFSGLLSAPRLTAVWLVLAESALVQRVHEAAVHRVNILLERRQPPVKRGGIDKGAAGNSSSSGDDQAQESSKGTVETAIADKGRSLPEARAGRSKEPRQTWLGRVFESAAFFWACLVFAPGLQVQGVAKSPTFMSKACMLCKNIVISHARLRVSSTLGFCTVRVSSK